MSQKKHDYFIINSDGEVLCDTFFISNYFTGFELLYHQIHTLNQDPSNVKVGLESTGHYSYNLLGFLLDKGLPTYIIKPLHSNLYRKSISLRQKKTDKVDARVIASMLMSEMNLQPYSSTSYHNEELKS